MIDHIKGILEFIILQTEDLPVSECDTPEWEGEFLTTFRKTVDFEKGQRHCAQIVLNFIKESEV